MFIFGERGGAELTVALANRTDLSGCTCARFGGYALIAVTCAVVSDASDSTVQAVGAVAFADLLFFAAPTWLVVTFVLFRWQRQGRPQLVQLTRRWDALLWLGPLLGLSLC